MAVESAILDRPVEGVPLPSFAHWLGVEMSREQKARPRPSTVHLPQRIEASLVGLFAPDLADAERGYHGLELARERIFLPVRTVDAHHLLSETDGSPCSQRGRKFPRQGRIHGFPLEITAPPPPGNREQRRRNSSRN